MKSVMDNKVLLSICIPTNGVVDWVIPVIESIYTQQVDHSLFEVVVADNGMKDDLKNAIDRFTYQNFHYYKTTAQGFTNQIECFRKASGEFRKMLNHRSCLLPNSLSKMLEVINKYKETKPILYFAEGHSHGSSFVECKNTDQFLASLTYYASWSAGVGVWGEDLEKIEVAKADKMFPHTVYLFDENLREEYVIWNEPYEQMADDSGKGGYDLFRTFAVGFLTIINRLKRAGRITENTFDLVKKELYVALKEWYLNEVFLPTKHTFILQNIKESMTVYYSVSDYYKMVIWSVLHYPQGRLRLLINKKKK